MKLFAAQGPISKQKMRETLGGSISLVALDHALGELWSQAAHHARGLQAEEGRVLGCALSLVAGRGARRHGTVGWRGAVALLSKYLDCVIAADQQELESFFGNFVPRSRVKEAVNALRSCRELEFVRVGNRSLIQLVQPKSPVIAKNRVGAGTPARPGRA